MTQADLRTALHVCAHIKELQPADVVPQQHVGAPTGFLFCVKLLSKFKAEQKRGVSSPSLTNQDGMISG